MYNQKEMSIEEQNTNQENGFQNQIEEENQPSQTILENVSQPIQKSLTWMIKLKSTLYEDLLNTNIQVRPCYILNKNILQHSQANETIRAKIRSFLMKQASKQYLLRQTCTLACYLFDLFFLRNGNILLANLQTMSIVCLTLACKLKQGRSPLISQKLFKKQDRERWQSLVMKKLSFFLNPVTHHTIAEKAIILWDHFIQKEKNQKIKLLQQKKGINLKIRTFFQILDCVFMVLQSLDFDLEELTLNHLFIYVRILNAPYDSPLKRVLEMTTSDFLKAFYSEADKFTIEFKKFLQFYRPNIINLHPQIGKFLRFFEGSVTPSLDEWKISQEKEEEPIFLRLRIFDCFQTSPLNGYELVKQYKQKRSQFE